VNLLAWGLSLYKIEHVTGNNAFHLKLDKIMSIKKIQELMTQKASLQVQLKAIEGELKKSINSGISKVEPTFDKDNMKEGDKKVILLSGVDKNVKVTLSYVAEHTRHIKGHVRQLVTQEDKKAFN